MESAERVTTERLFQIVGAVTEKDRAAIAVLVTGTARHEVSAKDLSVRVGAGHTPSCHFPSLYVLSLLMLNCLGVGHYTLDTYTVPLLKHPCNHCISYVSTLNSPHIE